MFSMFQIRDLTKNTTSIESWIIRKVRKIFERDIFSDQFHNYCLVRDIQWIITVSTFKAMV